MASALPRAPVVLKGDEANHPGTTRGVLVKPRFPGTAASPTPGHEGDIELVARFIFESGHEVLQFCREGFQRLG